MYAPPLVFDFHNFFLILVPKEEELVEEIPKEEEPKVLRGKSSKKEPEKPVEEEVKPKIEKVETTKIEIVSLSKPEEETEEIQKKEVILDAKRSHLNKI